MKKIVSGRFKIIFCCLTLKLIRFIFCVCALTKNHQKAPDYFEVIEKPMDFSTIKNKLNNFKYNDYTNTIDDIRLVFQNCRRYNEPGSVIYATGVRLGRHFEANAKQAGLLDTKRLALPYTSANNSNDSD